MSNSAYQQQEAEFLLRDTWLENLGRDQVDVTLIKQGWGNLKLAHGIEDNPMCVGGTPCAWGLGTHADSEIKITSPRPLRRFRAWIGVDHNPGSQAGAAKADTALPQLVFRVKAAGKTLAESPVLNFHSPAMRMECALDAESSLTLEVIADKVSLAHGDWGCAEVETIDGEWLRLGESAIHSPFLPLSFEYGDLDSVAFFRRYGIRREVQKLADHDEINFASGGVDAGLLVELKIKSYHDLPAVEWQVFFSNPGTNVSAPLRKVRSMVLEVPKGPLGRLHRAKGAFHRGWGAEAFRKSFFPETQDLDEGMVIESRGVEGRPSVDWMPYFNLEIPGVINLMGGIGWSGQWQSEVSCADSLVNIVGGIERFDAQLQPGERLRFPSALLLFYCGEAQRGHNLLRRFLREKVMHRNLDGSLPETLPLSNISWGGMPESEHLDRIANIRARRMPFDVYWIDAGWYGPEGTISPDEFDSAWGMNAGRWEFNPTVLPNQLRKISEAAHAAGMKQLLWCEPERAICGTPVTLEHPQWFLGEAIQGSNLLLDLGSPDAWQWCFDTISRLVRENGLDWYRQDFNFGPEPYWRKADEANRVGIHEVRYVNGLYRLWDELLKAFPHLSIDNCASGGRRLEFELLRYSVPLWASDMQCFAENEADWNQHHVGALAQWLPIFAFGTQNQAGGDTYNFRSVAAAGAAIHYFSYERLPISEEFPHEWLRRNMEELKATQKFYCGDYYPLTEFSDSGTSWVMMQFDRPDLKAGLLKVFRSERSPYEKARVCLKELTPDAIYEVVDADAGILGEWSGNDLMCKGLDLTMLEARSSRLITYRRRDI